jgi:hypothetical protein
MSASGSPKRKKKRLDPLSVGAKVLIKSCAVEMAINRGDAGQMAIIEKVNLPGFISHYVVYVPSSGATWALRLEDVEPLFLNLEVLFHDPN